MNKNAIKKYAIWARRELIERVSQRAMIYGITPKEVGHPDADSVHGHLLSQTEKKQRQALIRIIGEKGYTQVMEEVAYTWFNRFAALRFMEVNGYLPSHVRVFTNDAGEFKPQILAEAIHLELDGLDMKKVYALENENQSEELFKYLLIVQCNALNSILPGMFQRIDDYTELLLPDYLLREGSVIEQLVTTIPEADWTDQVQIIGWLYQYYNTEPKDKVFADLKKNIKITKENIPAATQLFTPDWIVHYMVENSLGRLWIERKIVSSSELVFGSSDYEEKRQQIEKTLAEKFGWKYYLPEAPQEPDVRKKLITTNYQLPTTPQELRVIDPCCGSGHILCVLFDVLVSIYEDYGITPREAATKIVEHNLWGLDIDERAAQLSYFAVMMKARQYDRRFFTRNVQPHVYSPKGYPEGLEYGSLITVDALEPAPEPSNRGLFDENYSLALNHWNFRYALSQKYHVVVTNPPYMSITNANNKLYNYVAKYYPKTKADLYSAFIEQCEHFTNKLGYCSMITQQSWLSLSSFYDLREYVFLSDNIVSMAQLGSKGFDEISGEVVSSVAFVARQGFISSFKGIYCDLQSGNSESEKETMFLTRSNYHETTQDNFTLIPNKVVVYNASNTALRHFQNDTPLSSFVTAKPGMQTSDNDRFLRLWFEIVFDRIGFGLNHENAAVSEYKWFPYNKGIGYRKWYGNNDYVVNFYHDGEELKYWLTHNPKDPKTKHWSRNMRNYSSYFEEGITFTAIGATFSARLNGKGYLFDTKGPMMFGRGLFIVCGFVNSIVFDFYNRMLCKQITKTFDSVNLVPFAAIDNNSYGYIKQTVNNNLFLSKTDWDSFETSWDFAHHPLLPRRVVSG